MTANRSYGCEEALRYFDTLTAGEAASDPKALEHLADCPSCVSELELQTRLRAKLKAAVRGEMPIPGLQDRIRAAIREKERARGPWFSNRIMLLAAAMVGVCFAALLVTQTNRSQPKASAQDAFISGMQLRVAAVFGVGLSDHLHCSWFRKFPSAPPTDEELARKIGPEYAPLIPIVRKQVPEKFRMVIAHKCSYRGRKFVHLSLRNDDNLLSVVIADKQPGESFPGGGTLHHAAVDQFQISGFESDGRLVYLISDLRSDENSNLVAALAPDVQRFLGSLKG